jgi:D-cysteine desulfhydrase family pyridoxal phosphate-dependent enzyme
MPDVMGSTSEYPDKTGRLTEIPRVRLFSGPTPLQPMQNLAAACGIQAQLFVKRDDCTEVAFGGNKVRQLEYYLGEARAQNANTILITGAVQSNFVRLAAACANKLGMECHIQLEERVTSNDPAYRVSGNVLIDQLLGATLHSFPEGEDEQGADKQQHRLADNLSAIGQRPYIIPLGPDHAPLGALGYVDAAREILDQISDKNITIDEIVVGSGSGNTHAGLLFGLRALGSEIRVTGICVRRDAKSQESRIKGRCQDIAELLELAPKVRDEDINLLDDFLAPGYGTSGALALQAILTAARTEGLILDPVYTGKAMAGFIHRARQANSSHLLFIHTGGTPAIFGYQNDLSKAANAKDK